MSTVRRFLFLVAFCFWQGGFTFYAAVVVPIGTEELGSALAQGFITRRVTQQLNVTGAVALALLAWDCWVARDPSSLRRYARPALWLVMVLALAALFHLHGLLEGMLDLDSRILADHRAFRPLHRLYLWVQTVQWGASVLLLLLSVAAWRAQDRKEGKEGTEGTV
jgi:hypothetical protein